MVTRGRAEQRILRERCAARLLVDFAGDSDAGLPEDVGNLSFAQSRRVVFKGELIFLFVDAKAPEAVGVREFAESAELFEAQWGLQFVCDLEECHESKYTGEKHNSERAVRWRVRAPEGWVWKL